MSRGGHGSRPPAGCAIICVVVLAFSPICWWLFQGKVAGRRGRVLASIDESPDAFWGFVGGSVLVVGLLVLGYIAVARRNRRDRF
jgi:hypothetical protein